MEKSASLEKSYAMCGGGGLCEWGIQEEGANIGLETNCTF